MKRLIMVVATAFCLCTSALAADPASVGVCPEDKLIMGTGDSKGTYAVMNRNIELFRRIDDVCGEGDVLLAWAAVTAWVIVDKDDGGRP